MSELSLNALRLRAVRLPVRWAPRCFFAQPAHGETIVVEVEAAGGLSGYGEVSVNALEKDASSFSWETFLEAASTAAEAVLERRRFETPADFVRWLSTRVPQRSGRYDLQLHGALELGLLDLASRHWRVPISELLERSTESRQIRYNAFLTTGSGTLAGSIAAAYARAGFAGIRIRLTAPLTDSRMYRLLRGIRRAQTRPVLVILDAKGAWDRRTAVSRLPGLAEAGVDYVEDPLSSQEAADYRRLREEAPESPGILVDGPIRGPGDARRFLGHVDAFNLKLGKHGGLRQALAIHRLAADAGARCGLGAEFAETSLLTAAGRLLSHLCGDLLFHDGAFGRRLFARDLTRDPLTFDGAGRASSSREHGFGLGVSISKTGLDALTRQRLTLPLSRAS